MRRSILGLLTIYLSGVLAAATIGQEVGKPPKLAEVNVASAEPVTLGTGAKFSNIPDYVAEAKIHAGAPKGRELEFTAKSEGLVIIAASWTYDGNESGGWHETRTTRDQLVEQGWIALDDLTWNEKDTHTLFFRQVKAGNKFKFHTRKYNQPFLIEADPAKLAAAADRFTKAAALATKTKPLPAVPADKPQRGEIKVAGAEQVILSGEEQWSPLPEYLKGATLFQQPSGNVLDLTANRDVQVVVAASWSYDGNQSGGWFAGRLTLPQLIAAGWEPIGTIVQKDRGDYTLLRRSLKAGEQVKFHTRKHNPPVAMLASPNKAKLLAAAKLDSTAKSSLAAIKPPTPRPATTTGKGLVLRLHEPDREDRFAVRGVIVRELVRQAMLLAAREELGLSTRDDGQRERGVGGGVSGPLPLDVLVHVQDGGLVNVVVFRFVNDQPEIIWEKQLVLQGEDLILALTTEAERLSREELLISLKKAGYSGQPNRVSEKSDVDAEVATLLAEMHPLSQFAAARRLHRSLHEQGESPERLANLARAYANLGALTEHLWSPAHKVYKARALLYAERAASRWPNSPAVLIGRAHARALAGLHQAALDDLTSARALAGDNAGARSADTGLLESFCRFEVAKLDDLNLPADQRQLARLLKLLAVERYAGLTAILKSSEQLLTSVPDSDRAIDALYETHRLGTRSQAVDLGLERTPQGLYRRLLAWDDLPRRSEALVSQAGGDDPAAERRHRLALIRAMRSEGELGADNGEPSLQAVAAWIEEVAFLQAIRKLQFLEEGLSVSLDDTRAELEELLVGHPLAPFVASLRDSQVERGPHLAELLRVIKPAEVSENEMFLWSWLDEEHLEEGRKLHRLAFQHQDVVYRDLLHNLRDSRELAWVEFSGHLRRASPYSPLTVAGTIRYDWSYAAPRAADWEKLYVQSPHVQGALGKQYLKQDKLDDAVRCLTRQVALQPEFEAYDALAEAWEKKKDEAKFIATWDEFLKQEDYGLSHAQARVRVAEHLMFKGKWQQALPYSEQAAGTGAQWAMDCAADCLTGLKRWPEAEEYTRASSERYPYLAPAWYFWCRRTNQGAIAAASSYAREVLGNPGADVSAWYRAVFLTLNGQKAEALTLYRNVLKKKTHPTLAWHAVLLAEELKQPEVRDEMLLEVEKGAVQAEYQPDLFHSGELARAARDAMSDATKLPALAALTKEELAKVPDPGTRCDTAYVLGKFLVLHGQDAGWEILESAAAYPLGNPSSTLAAVDLRERKAGDKRP